MRPIFALPLLGLAASTLAACNVDNDSANDSVRLEYNQQRIEDAAASTARAAEEIGSGVGNVAVSAGRAVKNEVGDIDIDVDVNRTRSRGGSSDGAAANEASAR